MKTIKILLCSIFNILVIVSDVFLFFAIAIIEAFCILLRMENNFTSWLKKHGEDHYDRIMQVEKNIQDENLFTEDVDPFQKIYDYPEPEEIAEALLTTGGWNIEEMMGKFQISRHKINDISKWLQNHCRVLMKDKANKNRNILSVTSEEFLKENLIRKYPLLVSGNTY